MAFGSSWHIGQAMSRQNVELVRRAHSAFAEHGIEGTVQFSTHDIIIYSVAEWPDDPEYHGYDGIRTLSRQWTENVDDVGFDLHELHDAGDSVVSLYEMTGRIKGSATPVKQRLAAVFSDFRDGQFGQLRYFASWSDALEAAGLSRKLEPPP